MAAGSPGGMQRPTEYMYQCRTPRTTCCCCCYGLELPAATAAGGVLMLCWTLLLLLLQELALKLRAEGRAYDPKVFKKQKRKEHKGPGAGGDKPKHAKVKIKSSQRNKAPYHVSAGGREAALAVQVSVCQCQAVRPATPAGVHMNKRRCNM